MPLKYKYCTSSLIQTLLSALELHQIMPCGLRACLKKTHRRSGIKPCLEEFIIYTVVIIYYYRYLFKW